MFPFASSGEERKDLPSFSEIVAGFGYLVSLTCPNLCKYVLHLLTQPVRNNNFEYEQDVL